LTHRLHQIALALIARTPPAVDRRLFPNDAVWRLFDELHTHDQRHLIAVYQKASDAELPEAICTAGLLHDIGKVTLAGTRISLVARIAHVILQRAAPEVEARLIDRSGPWLGVGLHLAHNHSRLGARRLRALAVDPRICDIVEHHDDATLCDPLVRRLQEIDSATP
jgi:putative nucleotidyltransferase with HDIG domain